MVDLIILLKRVDTLSRETFRERWMANNNALYSHDSHCTRYIQCPVVSEPLPLPGMPTIDVSIDAIEKASFTDQPAFDAWLASEAVARSGLPTITAAMTIHVVKSHVVRDEVKQSDHGGLLKRMVLLNRKSALTQAQYFKHWFDIHAPLAKKVVGGSRLYIQHQALGEVSNPQAIRSLQLGLDGFSETWYDDEAELRRAGATPEGQAVAQDNLTFGGRSKRFFFEEIPVKE